MIFLSCFLKPGPLLHCMTIRNAKAWFRVTGVNPFNRQAINPPAERPSFRPETVPKKNESYLTLYSQAHPSQQSHPLMDYSSQLTSTPISQHLHNTLGLFSDLEYSSFSSPFLERSFSEDNLHSSTQIWKC